MKFSDEWGDGGGDSITFEMLQSQPQKRVVDGAEWVDGFQDGDPPRVKLTLIEHAACDGTVFYCNNHCHKALADAISAGQLPDEMSEWRGARFAFGVGKAQTKGGGTTPAKALKLLGWDEVVRGSEPAVTVSDDAPAEADPDFDF